MGRKRERRLIDHFERQLGTLESWFVQIVRANKLRWPDISDMIEDVQPMASPWAATAPHEPATPALDPRRLHVEQTRLGALAAETAAYQEGHAAGRASPHRTSSIGDSPSEACAYQTGFEDGREAGGWPAKARLSPATVLPDGSAFFTASFPLPEGHWLYDKDENGFQPEMPERLKLPRAWRIAFERNINEALRVAIRGATNGGKDKDLDPDALVLNFFNALFQPNPETQCHPIVSDTEESPVSGSCGDTSVQSTHSRRREI